MDERNQNMPTIRIPSPLRTYTEGQSEILVAGETVSEAMEVFVSRFPALRQHLFNGQGELRPFVNLYLNNEDVRHLEGLDTSLRETDRLMIVPSIAGGSGVELPRLDHSALRTNQAVIVLLCLLAFIFNAPWLVGLVAAVMGLGTLLGRPGFGFIYHGLLKPRGWLRPEVLRDNPEPHRFAQGLGTVFLAAGVLALLSGLALPGWALVWLVIALASLNLFVGFCAGCAVYYWLNRLRVPGFAKSPPSRAFPGMRPKAKA
jgi:molybdopterin converting factor small subunit